MRRSAPRVKRQANRLPRMQIEKEDLQQETLFFGNARLSVAPTADHSACVDVTVAAGIDERLRGSDQLFARFKLVKIVRKTEQCRRYFPKITETAPRDRRHQQSQNASHPAGHPFQQRPFCTGRAKNA